MKFKLRTTGTFYRNSGDMNQLKELGFSFEKPNIRMFNDDDDLIIKGNPTIEIKDLKGLIEFSKKFGEIIINKDKEIEIYNDYRE